MDEENMSIPTSFVATIYGDLVPLNNSALSRARLKIFYKGMNRNGSYINEEVAQQLLSTLPGTPIVGYYDPDKADFLGHIEKEANRAYGFVPETMNFKWEMSLDPDGVYRTYACTDIILWTGRYPVASKVVGKSHSMELNPETVQGEWKEQGDEYAYIFSHAEFLGLCVLGEEYEPCFEGSSFYELNKEKNVSIKADLKEMFSLYQTVNGAEENPTGGQIMDEDLENDLNPQDAKPDADKVDDVNVPTDNTSDENADDSQNTPNQDPEDNSEGNETGEGEEDSTEDDNQETNENDEGEEDDKENEEEDSEENEENDEETDESKTEADYVAQLAEKDAEIEGLKTEIENLKQFKLAMEKQEKEELLNSYSNKLTAEEVEALTAKLDEFESSVELKKEIALILLDKETNNTNENFNLIPNNIKQTLSGVDAIIARHVGKK